MQDTKIQWTDHTGGPFLVCSEVSPGCAHCYARELMLTRLGPIVRKAYRAAGLSDWESRPIWGDKAPRVLTKGFWIEAPRLDRAAAKAGIRERMFPSMIDWLDEMPAGIIDQEGNWLDPIEVLARFLKLIHETRNLDWLLLTKRPGNFFARTKEVLGMFRGPMTSEDASFQAWLTNMRLGWAGVTYSAPEVRRENYWIGTTVEDQKRADERIPELLKIPARVRFLSVEPMLEGIDFEGLDCWPRYDHRPSYEYYQIFLKAQGIESDGQPVKIRDGIDWVIFGGESGRGARACNIDWIRDGVRQCRAAGVAAFVKQLGANVVLPNTSDYKFPKDKKGGDMEEWPEDLRVREFPDSHELV